MIIGDVVRTPVGWLGTVRKFEKPPKRGRNSRICWVANEHGESHAFREADLTPGPRCQAMTRDKDGPTNERCWLPLGHTSEWHRDSIGGFRVRATTSASPPKEPGAP